jgi:thiamine biosynthesis lipoprotein
MKSRHSANGQAAVRALAILFALSAIPSQAQETDGPVRFEASHDAMGTLFTVVAYGRDTRYLAQVANEAFDEIDSLDRQMSNYKVESELSQINRRAARESVLVEPRLFELIAEAVRYSRESDGAFDISVGALMKSWGFFRGEGRMPTRADLAQVMNRVGYRHIHLDREAHQIRFDVEGLELDLGGIAKGFAVDRAAEILRSRGVEAALVSGGASSIYALGAPPGERAWRIRLRDPYEKTKSGDLVWLKNHSLSVSGSFEKFFTLQGMTYCHIIDPRSGRPVEGMLMAAVLAPLTVESDAMSTTLFVTKAEKSAEFLKTRPNLKALLYESSSPGRQYKRIPLQSAEWNLPADGVAEFDTPRSTP